MPEEKDPHVEEAEALEELQHRLIMGHGNEPLALLPELTAEELEELHQAIGTRTVELARLRDSSLPEHLAQRERRVRSIRVLWSLDTAVCEAKSSLGPPHQERPSPTG